MKSELANAVPRLKRLLPRFRKLRIGVLGDLMVDRYVWGNANRLSPEAAVPVVDYVSEQDCPGGAGNVAVNIAALGAQVDIFGVVGAQRTSGRGENAKKMLRTKPARHCTPACASWVLVTGGLFPMRIA